MIFYLCALRIQIIPVTFQIYYLFYLSFFFQEIETCLKKQSEYDACSPKPGFYFIHILMCYIPRALSSTEFDRKFDIKEFVKKSTYFFKTHTTTQTPS